MAVLLASPEIANGGEGMYTVRNEEPGRERIALYGDWIVMKRLISLLVLTFWTLVGCVGATETPAPPPPVITVVVVATPVEEAPPPVVTVVVTPPEPIRPSIATPLSIPTIQATAAPTQPAPTPSRTPTRAPVKPTATTKPRPVASPSSAAPPGTLLDGNYASTGSTRVQFQVSDGGTVASGGFFSFNCQADGALSTYGFTDAAPVSGGKFEFTALPGASGSPMVSMACSVTGSAQARCVINNLIATKKCPNTSANVTRR